MHVIQEAVERGTHFAIIDLINERNKQVYVHDYTPERDDAQVNYEEDLVSAGMSYIEWAQSDMIGSDIDSPPHFWPWDSDLWKPEDTVEENLLKGMALVAAGYDKMKRDTL